MVECLPLAHGLSRKLCGQKRGDKSRRPIEINDDGDRTNQKTHCLQPGTRRNSLHPASRPKHTLPSTRGTYASAIRANLIKATPAARVIISFGHRWLKVIHMRLLAAMKQRLDAMNHRIGKADGVARGKARMNKDTPPRARHHPRTSTHLLTTAAVLPSLTWGPAGEAFAS